MGSTSRYIIVLLAAAGMALADFSMDQTSQITGGAMAGMLKMAARFSKQAGEAQHSTIAVKGDRMAHISANRASVIDVGKETITEIDFQKKTYSVMTFAEMTQMLQQASQKMHENPNQAQMNMKVSVEPTGQTRQINGLEAKETVLKLDLEVTDPQKGQSGTMEFITDMWLAPKAPGYDEVLAFYKRMAEKLNWTPGMNPMLAGRADLAKGMQEMMKRASSMDGMPVMQVVKMGGAGLPQGQAGAATAPQQQPEQQAEQPKPSATEAVAGALGGRLGRLGGFGRKKKPAQEQTEQTQSTAAPQQPAGSASLLEMTIETSNYSNAAVDSAKFEVPSGFKQIERKQQ